MRTSFLAILLTACGTNVYPVPNLGHVDGGDSQAQDGGKAGATLMQFYVLGDEDGGPTGVKLPDGAVVSTRDEDGGVGSVVPATDAGSSAPPDAGSGNVQHDAGQPQADAGPTKHWTCGSCIVDADCTPAHRCVERDTREGPVCLPTHTLGVSCSSLVGGAYLVFRDDTTCEPGNPTSGASLTCAQWHTATGL